MIALTVFLWNICSYPLWESVNKSAYFMSYTCFICFWIVLATFLIKLIMNEEKDRLNMLLNSGKCFLGYLLYWNIYLAKEETFQLCFGLALFFICVDIFGAACGTIASNIRGFSND